MSEKPATAEASPQREAAAIFTLIVATVWIAYVFLRPESSSLLLHPLLGIGIVFFLLPFRTNTACRRGVIVALAIVGYWLAARLSLAWVPFLTAFILAYLLRFLYNELREIHLPTGQVVRLSKHVAQATILVGFLGVALLVSLVLIPGIVQQVAELVNGARIAYVEVAKFRTESVPIDLLEARVVQGEELLWLAKDIELADEASVAFNTRVTSEHVARFRDAEVESVPVQVDSYWEMWAEQFSWLDVDGLDLDSVFGSAGAEIGQRLQTELEDKLSGLADIAADLVGWLFRSSRVVLSTTLGLLATFVLSLIVLAYLLRAFDSYLDVFLLLLPVESWQRARNVARGVDHSLQAFLRGQFYIIVVIAVLTTVAYRLAGIPFALLLGIFGGLLNTIPNVGVFLAGGFALIALIVGSITGLEPGILLFIEVSGFRGFLLRAMLIPVALFTVQTIDNSLISPRVMSRALSVDPLLIMFSVLAGGALMGFWGVLLAIPTLVIVKSAWESYDADGIPPAAVDPAALAPRDDEVSSLDDL